MLADRYEMVKPIATGGMAQVWEATDRVLGRRVAVKVLHAHLADDAAFVDRFRREAVSAARLVHPSIVSIYDTVSSDGYEAIVMELVEGTTLRTRLDDGPLDPGDAREIGAQVADALGAAHKAGLIHRDIKPANILLCDEKRVKVADFGIAKVAEGSDTTAEGTMLGTAKYLAPEQVEGKPVDARSDVYGLGVVLYEMVTGRPPFLADTDAATALARLHQTPQRPSAVGNGVPPGLDDVIMRALARAPADRFGSAADLRAALLALDVSGAPGAGGDATFVETPPSAERTPPGGAPPVPRRPSPERRWVAPVMVAVLIAVALGVAGLLLGRTIGDNLLSDEGNDSSGDGAAAAAVTPTDAESFDPEGDGDENPDQVTNVLDDDPATTWHTDTYRGPEFGNLKSGVGLVFTLGEATELGELLVDSPTDGWSADVYVASSPAGDLAGWGEPIASQQDITAGETRFDLGGAEGSVVLLWITDPGPDFRSEIGTASFAS